MKRRFKLSVLLLSFFGFLTARAQDGDKKHEYKRYEHVKERNISKTYPASGNTLNIINSFGDVTVTTGGSEIKVDIHIEASSNDKDLAEKIFNNLDVADSREGNQVKFKTTTNKDKKEDHYNCKNCNSSMMINYKVQLPAGTPLVIENSFGDIVLPDYTGPVSLTSKFGSLKTGTLSKTEKLLVEFGEADLKQVDNIKAVFKFSKINIASLSGTNNLQMEFCTASRINFASNLSGLTLKESYSTVNLKPALSFSASYEIKTSFGNFKNKTSTEIKRTDEPDKYGPDADRRYEGGSGAAKVQVTSSFGNIILGDATDEEMRSKGKTKSKAKEI